MTVDLAEHLASVLDTLLPGDAVFPSASAVGLAERLLERQAFAEPAMAAMVVLPPGSLAADASSRVAALETLEATHPVLFGRFLTAVYSAYYSAQPTLEAVEQATGYAARPPQPEGYLLKPFDPEMLAVPASRAPHYRTVPEQR